MIGCLLLPPPEPNGASHPHPNGPHPSPLPQGEGAKAKLPPQRGGLREGDPARLETLAARLAAFSDRVELRPAGCYLELSHLARSEWPPVAAQIAQVGQAELGRAVRLGLAPGQFSAALAAAATSPLEPITIIPPEQAAAFLVSQPLAALALPAAMQRRLVRLGLTSLGDLAGLPPGAVLAQFGAEGRRWQELAQGRDERPVARYRPPAVAERALCFEGPVVEQAPLEAAVAQLAEALAGHLARCGLAAGGLSLHLTLAEGGDWSARCHPAQPLSRAERLSQSLLVLLPAALPGPVSGLRLRLTELQPLRPEQLALFGPDRAESGALAGLLPQLVARFGPCFYQARLTEPLAYLPEERFGLAAVSGWR